MKEGGRGSKATVWVRHGANVVGREPCGEGRIRVRLRVPCIQEQRHLVGDDGGIVVWVMEIRGLVPSGAWRNSDVLNSIEKEL